MNRGGYSGGHGGHYGGMGYNGGYGMGPGPGPMHSYGGGGGMMGGGGGAGVGGGGAGGGTAGAGATANITNSNDPKSKASRVFLGNLNTGFVKRPEVDQVFRKYGPVLGISLHNGFGFVQFSNEHSAKNAVMEEQGRVMAYQPLDLRIASDPDKNRPKGFRRVQGEIFSGYVDPSEIPVHPSSGAGSNGNPPTRKRMKRFIDSTNIITQEKEADEPDEWQCSICKVKVQSAWQLIKHAHKTHDIQIFMEKPTPAPAPIPTI